MAQNENELLSQIGADLGVDETDSKNPVAQLRSALQRRDQKVADLETKLQKAPEEALTAAKAQIEREGKATEFAMKLGYPKIAGRFLKDNPEGDVTEDALRTFVTEDLGLEVKEPPSPPQPGGEPPPGEPPAGQQPAPQQIGTGNVAGFHQGGGAPTGQKRYTGAEALAAYNRGEITVEDFTRALDEGSITKGDPGYVVHKQPG